jgi:hypothetical protein
VYGAATDCIGVPAGAAFVGAFALACCGAGLGWGADVCEQLARTNPASKTGIQAVARFMILDLCFIFSLAVFGESASLASGYIGRFFGGAILYFGTMVGWPVRDAQ